MNYTICSLFSFFSRLPKSIICRTFLVFVSFPFLAHAQLNVTAPLERAVYQRDADGYATVTVSGSYSQPIDKLEIHATPVNTGQGTEVAWTTLQENPTGGIFSGTLRLIGGWYKLEVRGSKGGVIVGSSDVVSKVGVGEVLIIAGQSNAQGMDYESPAASDDRVNYVNYDNEISNSLGDLPEPVFSQLGSSTYTLGLRGHGTWCWGILGDLLAAKLNVPVMFINDGWSGTSITNWVKSSQGQVTTGVFSDLYTYPTQMPYANLRLTFQHYVKQYGARAVLWMQGESDNLYLHMGADEYKTNLKSLIAKLSSDVNRTIPWMISRTSWMGNTVSADIIAGQNAAISELSGIAFAGPNTDNLDAARSDGTHFYGTASLTVLANAWNDAMTTSFFSSASPLSVTNEPAITSACATNNTSLNLSLPTGYTSYIWQQEVNGTAVEIGQTSRTINISGTGTYMAKLKDVYGNTLRSQKIVISTAIKPSTPVIQQADAQQICANDTFTFSVNSGNETYSWYQQGNTTALGTGSSFSAATEGTYYVKSQSVYGCVSDNSSSVALTVRPEIPTPVVEKTGPFTVMATIIDNDLDEFYEWKRDESILTSSTNTVKADETGVYSARAAATFTLGKEMLTCYSAYSNELSVVTDGESDIILFPNPGARDDVYVESRDDIENAEITVYDLYGRVVAAQTQDLISKVKVQVKNLPSGKYIVRIRAVGIDIKKPLVVL